MTPYQSKLSALRKVVEAGTQGAQLRLPLRIEVDRSGNEALSDSKGYLLFQLLPGMAADPMALSHVQGLTQLLEIASPDRATAMLDLVEAYEITLLMAIDKITHYYDPIVDHGSGPRCHFCYRDKAYGHEECPWVQLKEAESRLARAKEALT